MKQVTMAVIFAAVVPADTAFTLCAEHDHGAWQSFDDAVRKIAWPRSRSALRDIREMLAGGDAGPIEDVMRLPLESAEG